METGETYLATKREKALTFYLIIFFNFKFLFSGKTQLLLWGTLSRILDAQQVALRGADGADASLL